MPSEAKALADKLMDEFLSAESAEDRAAIQPAFLAASKASLIEAKDAFRKGMFVFLDLAGMLEQAILTVNAPGAKARLEKIANDLGLLTLSAHDTEGLRKTWTSGQESDEIAADEQLVPPAGTSVPLPGGPPANLVKAITLSASRDYHDLADEYVLLFRSARYKDAASEGVARKFARVATDNKARYEAVSAPLGIPWWWVAGAHLLESSFNFKTHLHNGDSLSGRTYRVPAGRPAGGHPPFSWEDSARDALTSKGLDGLTDWSIARALHRWEAYNGFGYRGRQVATPYLWSFSDHYGKGKFIVDGGYSATAVSKQCGAAVFLKALAELGAVELAVELVTEGPGEAQESDSADAQAVVDNNLPNIDGTTSTNVDFKQFFEMRVSDVKHFAWHEFLVKGGSHAQSGLNTDPPGHLWPNVIQLARVLDRFRVEIGHPVILTSVYRSPDYNATLTGAAKTSQHMQFRAADLKVVGAGGPNDWAQILRKYRNEGMFEGGIGVYGTFVHVDTRGQNANW